MLDAQDLGTTITEGQDDQDLTSLEKKPGGSSDSETYQERCLRIQKEHTINNIFSMLDIIERRFGEDKRADITGQLTEFLTSEKKENRDISYLEDIEQRIRSHLSLQREMQEEEPEDSDPTELEEKSISPAEQQKNLLQSEIDVILETIKTIRSVMIEKQKELYCLLESMSQKTYDANLSIGVTGKRRDPSFTRQYARLLSFPAMKDGLPYDIPEQFMRYIKTYGIGNAAQELKKALSLVHDITELQSQINTPAKEFLSKEEIQAKISPYVSDSSSVFTGALIPIPINRLSAKGTVERERNNEISEGYPTREEYEIAENHQVLEDCTAREDHEILEDYESLEDDEPSEYFTS